MSGIRTPPASSAEVACTVLVCNANETSYVWSMHTEDKSWQNRKHTRDMPVYMCPIPLVPAFLHLLVNPCFITNKAFTAPTILFSLLLAVRSFQTTLVLLRLSPYAFMHLFTVHWHFASVHLGLYHLTRSKLRSCTPITFCTSPSHTLQSVGRHVFISAYHRSALLYAPRPAGPSRS